MKFTVHHRIAQPLKRFVEFEAASGVLMVAAGALALVIANSSWHLGFSGLWSHRAGVRMGGVVRLDELTIRDWINDAGLALFFLLAGIEVKRQLVVGELRDKRAAALPIFGALGGMVVPAVIYLTINPHAPASRGWGTTVATDLALAAAVVIALGSRVPPAVKAFIVTLAVVDDVGGVIVVALFYGHGLSWKWVALVVLMVSVTIGLRRSNVSWVSAYVPAGVVTWYGFRRAGIEPALCGVLFGLMIPVADPLGSGSQAEQSDVMNTSDELDESPMERIENALNPLVSFAVLPLFALANSGIRVTGATFNKHVVSGVVVARLAGKVLGISGFVWFAMRMGWGRLTNGLTMRHIVGMGCAAGMGFTVSLFVSEKAFGATALDTSAKAGVLIAAMTSGVLSFVLLRKSANSA